MSWAVELLQRDGSVLARQFVNAPAAELDGALPEVAALTIGRALDNDLVLEDTHCAPHHARLEVNSNGQATLIDLDTHNGIYRGRRERLQRIEIAASDIFRLGQSTIRVRSLASSMTPEQPLSTRMIWPWALLALAVVMAHGAWEMWLRHVTESTPSYLYELSGQAFAVCAWSGVYALLGRLITGNERFFTHVLIACCGLLTGVVLLEVLEITAFATSWLFPIQITQIVVVLVAAMTIRFHLRIADPRHWPTLRYAVVLVATLSIIVPIVQKWITQDRITDVQTLNVIRHPVFRLANPASVESFNSSANELRDRTDALRKKNAKDGSDYEGYGGYDPDD
jgi:pSer/pThr/pTyr-binding forkhead associated (FHA) protein